MLVETILHKARRRLVTLGHDAVVADAAIAMRQPNADLIIICQSGAAIGVVTKTDIATQFAEATPDAHRPLIEIMRRSIISCAADERLIDVWCSMIAHRVQRVPVLEGQKPLGVIYTRDALQALLGDAEHEDAALRAYVQGVGYQ